MPAKMAWFFHQIGRTISEGRGNVEENAKETKGTRCGVGPSKPWEMFTTEAIKLRRSLKKGGS